MTTRPNPHFCRRCGRELTPGRGSFYHVTIEAIADPSLSLAGEEQETRPQIEALLDQLTEISEQEAMDQVYRREAFDLCGPCYRRWIANPTG